MILTVAAPATAVVLAPVVILYVLTGATITGEVPVRANGTNDVLADEPTVTKPADAVSVCAPAICTTVVSGADAVPVNDSTTYVLPPKTP